MVLECIMFIALNNFLKLLKIDFSDLERLRSIKFSKLERKIFRPLQNSPKDISNDDLVKESRAVVLKYLDITLPEDIPTKNKKISALVKSLRPKLNRIPTCFFYEIYHAVHNINMEKDMSAFVSKFYPLLDVIKHERKKNHINNLKSLILKLLPKKLLNLRHQITHCLKYLRLKEIIQDFSWKHGIFSQQQGIHLIVTYPSHISMTYLEFQNRIIMTKRLQLQLKMCIC